MQLYFIRHGQSENNRLYDELGRWDGRNPDPELTELGYQQAQLLAEHLARVNLTSAARRPDYLNRRGFDLTHLYTSLMARAVATAVPVAEALGLPLVAWEDLHEVGGIFVDDENTGEPVGLPGKTRSDFAARFPQLVLPAALREDGWWNRPHETHEQQVMRAYRFVRDLIERHGHTDNRVAVVSHGGFYNHVMAVLLDQHPNSGFWFNLNNTAITRLDFEEDGRALIYANHADHLPLELIT